MTGDRPLRIALFTHSTNPRGGVVHALELAGAIARLGHEVFVHGPSVAGVGFFRAAPKGVTHVLVPASPASASNGLAALVQQRVGEYVAYLQPRGCEYDIYHAQDGISGNALADLVEANVIPAFTRTVHHLDAFADPFLRRAQHRSITLSASLLCVSDVWRQILHEDYGLEATMIFNGVDTERFSPRHAGSDAQTLQDISGGQTGQPVFLTVGGIERRKNTLNILRAFMLARRQLPAARLLIVGGDSLLDHSDYRAEFDRELAVAGPDAARAVQLIGTVPETALAAIYRNAGTLFFPSVSEGFGLAVLEAMACGTPVITSRIAPFTEYLTDQDAILVNPHDVEELAAALVRSVEPSLRQKLSAAGLAVAQRFPWSTAATAHISEYHRLLALAGAARPAGNVFSSSPSV